MDLEKVKSLQEWQPPQRVKDVQRLLGFANYYHTFIPHFATLTTPLSNLLRKGVKFHWGAEEQRALDAIKAAFASKPILKHPDPLRLFVVETDASDVAVGAVLQQAYGPTGTLFPCAYYSWKLSAPEQNYTIWDKELLAVKVTFETWWHHLEGVCHQVKVQTDHQNLEHPWMARTLNQQQVRWSLFFARFNFRVTYVPSGWNPRADALSRKPEFTQKEDKIMPRTVIPLERLAATEEPMDLRSRICEAQQQDLFVAAQCHELAGDEGDKTPWKYMDDLLQFRDHIYVPGGSLHGIILRQCHDSPSAGHFGVFKTMHFVSRTFWWL
ncbi:retrotransposon-like 1 [Crotalus adamanteus]|uniref:Retrotransposon-like 1 n=1 Tax=Crotalus adamanteus TaxID=8729 RepID=A0AAW1B0X5_CROAD